MNAGQAELADGIGTRCPRRRRIFPSRRKITCASTVLICRSAIGSPFGAAVQNRDLKRRSATLPPRSATTVPQGVAVSAGEQVVLAQMGCVVEGIERPDCTVVFVSLYAPVGAGNPVTSRDLGVFVDQAAEPVPQDPDIRAHDRRKLAPVGRTLAERPVRPMDVIVVHVLA
jgi:hypothetical protein